MPYMDEFESVVTTSKRNNRYYGPTESQKIASTLSEIKTDLTTIFNEINTISSNLEALASGYMMASGYADNFYDIRMKLYEYESRVEKLIYTQAEQA